jgi:hypothetical protein
VQQARYVDAHLAHALRAAALCSNVNGTRKLTHLRHRVSFHMPPISNDPICAQHSPGEGMEARWLHGAACHGCALIAETSCEVRNDYLDRSLVVPILGLPDVAFCSAVG